MKRLAIGVLCLSLLGCNKMPQTANSLERINHLLNTDSIDDAIALIDSIAPGITSATQAEQMRFGLLYTKAMNLAFIPITSDSIMRPVAEYYDRHGSPNEKMEAFYLKGCAYRDMGEAPLAIISFKEALERGDTLSEDCNFATVFRIYGQMAEVYRSQHLTDERLEAVDKAGAFALLAGDTINYIRCFGLKSSIYLSKNDYDAMVKCIDKGRALYIERGMTREAARLYHILIQVKTDQMKFDEARKLIDIYESESGLFDENGATVPSNILYNYTKGLFYCATGKLDSAEILFRTLLPDEMFQPEATHGLMCVYQRRQQVDSVLLYAQRYDAALNKMLERTQMEAVTQAEGMYDYHRLQQEAWQERNARTKMAMRITVVSILLIVGGLYIAIRYIRERRRNKRRLQELMEAQAKAERELSKLKNEHEILSRTLSHTREAELLLQDKTQQVEQLESLVDSLKIEIAQLHDKSHGKQNRVAQNVQALQSILYPKVIKDGGESTLQHPRPASNEELNGLIASVSVDFPDFYAYITFQHKISDFKYKVCILSFLKFGNKNIASLLSSSERSVANARMALAKDVFGLTSSHELDECLDKWHNKD